MSEFFLELFSDEIPASLQKNAREALLQNFKFFFEKENIGFTRPGNGLQPIMMEKIIGLKAKQGICKGKLIDQSDFG